MSADPAALQLRLLQTVVEVAAEKNSTLVMPFPVELLRFFDHASGAAATDEEAAHTPALVETPQPVEPLNGHQMPPIASTGSPTV
jgi:hypothetical protein